MRFLLTGATGFLGREVLVRLLAAGHQVLATTRARPGETQPHALERLRQIALKTVEDCPLEGLSVAHADVAQADLGLNTEARDWLFASEQIQLIHGAAEVRFDLPYEKMRQQNVQGTAHLLKLAQQLYQAGKLVRLDHVSTAFVAGNREDLALESEGDQGQKPRNDYERTKLEAEALVKAAQQDGLPAAIHRPSIIVGDSRTGKASSFKVLYWPLKVYARGRFRTLFGRPQCTVDVVPVDYVAEALVALVAEPQALGQTFHLAAGPQRQSTISELTQMAQELFERPKVRYIDPDFYTKYLRPVIKPVLKRFRPDVAERGGVYLPYFRSNPSFDVQNTQALLKDKGIEPPEVQKYFKTIMQYALDTDFGRRL